MTDTDPNPDPRSERQRSAGEGGLEDMPLENPLDAVTRGLVAHWLTVLADVFVEDLADGPTDAELSELEVDVAEWTRRNENAIKRLRSTARRITEDPVAFSVAGEARNLLQAAEDHRLRGAGAALDRAIAAALPARLDAYTELVERNKAQHGFHIQVVGGRGDPLPLPQFIYTEGLAERAGHPELVMVGVPTRVAAALLTDLATQILASERTLRAGEDLYGLVYGDYALRVIDCPAALVDQVQDRGQPVGVLQLVIPDRAGRFPGDHDVDAKFADAQQYPDYSG